jgi:hypothetical protein
MCLRHLPHLPPKPGPHEGSRDALMHPFAALEKLMRLLTGSRSSREVRLPPGYRVDHSDPDVLALRCPGGAAVARFSSRGAAAEAIEQEARTHYRERNRSA